MMKMRIQNTIFAKSVRIWKLQKGRVRTKTNSVILNLKPSNWELKISRMVQSTWRHTYVQHAKFTTAMLKMSCADEKVLVTRSKLKICSQKLCANPLSIKRIELWQGSLTFWLQLCLSLRRLTEPSSTVQRSLYTHGWIKISCEIPMWLVSLLRLLWEKFLLLLCVSNSTIWGQTKMRILSSPTLLQGWMAKVGKSESKTHKILLTRSSSKHLSATIRIIGQRMIHRVVRVLHCLKILACKICLSSIPRQSAKFQHC